MEIRTVTYEIVRVKGHYEVYDENGKFVTSGDTYRECEEDVRELAA